VSASVLLWRVVLAAPSPPGGSGAPPGSERGEEFGKTSPIALVVILLLGLATALLIRSMSKRLRNVPASFDDVDARGRPRGGASGPGPAAERLDAAGDEPRPDPRAGPTGSP